MKTVVSCSPGLGLMSYMSQVCACLHTVSVLHLLSVVLTPALSLFSVLSLFILTSFSHVFAVLMSVLVHLRVLKLFGDSRPARAPSPLHADHPSAASDGLCGPSSGDQ